MRQAALSEILFGVLPLFAVGFALAITDGAGCALRDVGERRSSRLRERST